MTAWVTIVRTEIDGDKVKQAITLSEKYEDGEEPTDAGPRVIAGERKAFARGQALATQLVPGEDVFVSREEYVIPEEKEESKK